MCPITTIPNSGAGKRKNALKPNVGGITFSPNTKVTAMQTNLPREVMAEEVDWPVYLEKNNLRGPINLQDRGEVLIGPTSICLRATAQKAKLKTRIS